MSADNVAWYELVALEDQEDTNVYYLSQDNEETYEELSFD